MKLNNYNNLVTKIFLPLLLKLIYIKSTKHICNNNNLINRKNLENKFALGNSLFEGSSVDSRLVYQSNSLNVNFFFNF